MAILIKPIERIVPLDISTFLIPKEEDPRTCTQQCGMLIDYNIGTEKI
jgi:hypothetical protein